MKLTIVIAPIILATIVIGLVFQSSNSNNDAVSIEPISNGPEHSLGNQNLIVTFSTPDSTFAINSPTENPIRTPFPSATQVYLPPFLPTFTPEPLSTPMMPIQMMRSLFPIA